jgi:predicted transcriptional regulator YdeE
VNTVKMDSFFVIGREARTSNAREMSGQGVIGQMWSSGVPTGSPVVAVYSEYASDKDGEYNYLLGRKRTEEETVPKEMAHRMVAGGSYLHLQFAGSVSPEAVMGLWREVWEMEHLGKIQRTYKTDFELYGDAGFDLYVGVKD